TGHSGPGLYCECVGAEEEGCILLDGTAPAIGQSAQAVDLGQFRQAVHDQYELAKQERDAERISEDSLIWHAARRDRLLALIDSQAVQS
ncbi:TPA: hypothetical protein ACOFEK_002780, partial [Stenotrophomonas maltophilia]